MMIIYDWSLILDESMSDNNIRVLRGDNLCAIYVGMVQLLKQPGVLRDNQFSY